MDILIFRGSWPFLRFVNFAQGAGWCCWRWFFFLILFYLFLMLVGAGIAVMLNPISRRLFRHCR